MLRHDDKKRLDATRSADDLVLDVEYRYTKRRPKGHDKIDALPSSVYRIVSNRSQNAEAHVLLMVTFSKEMAS